VWQHIQEVSVSELEELRRRVGILEDKEAIRELRHKYFRCLDGKLWEEMAQCFADDVSAEYFNGEFKFKGKDETIGFFKMGLTEALVGMHHGHHPEIEITSDNTARGTWGLYNYLVDRTHNRGQRIAGIYQDEYVKQNGKWKIKSIACNQIFQENWDRNETPSLKLTFRGTPEYAATPAWRGEGN